MTGKIDPRLATEMKRAARAKRPVEAYVVIRQPEKGSAKAAVKSLLGRVARKTHVRAVRSQYLELLESIHVAAPPAFLKALIDEPEVVTANMAPSSDESAMIKPVKPRRVRAKDIGTPVRRGATR